MAKKRNQYNFIDETFWDLKVIARGRDKIKLTKNMKSFWPTYTVICLRGHETEVNKEELTLMKGCKKCLE